MMWGSWGNGWWGFAMGLVMLLFVALLVVGIVVLVRSSSGGEPRNAEPSPGRALDILDERFARGEIDAKEYEERRRILTEGR
jgi:putative membrane protein